MYYIAVVLLLIGCASSKSVSYAKDKQGNVYKEVKDGYWQRVKK